MARPIAPTPTLRGKAARRFVEAAKNPEPFVAPKVDVDKLVKIAHQILKADEPQHS
jgi:hypothetical protein